MQSFISDISQNKFHESEKIAGKAVRIGILKEIQKDVPDFNDDCALSVSELNHYRQLYVRNLLSKEIGTLTELEQTVLDNINQNHLISDEASEIKNPSTRGQRWADRIAAFGGSWRFLGIFGLFMLGWMSLNIIALREKGFDPYPFILLNLILSCIAAIQAPVIMMSQNRQEEKDRERAKNDYMVNLKGELEIRMLHEKIDHLLITQEENLLEMQQIQIKQMTELMKKIDSKKE
ncbi:MAG: DUF1003 domain-containing protein [Ginsengibacter sp.]